MSKRASAQTAFFCSDTVSVVITGPQDQSSTNVVYHIPAENITHVTKIALGTLVFFHSVLCKWLPCFFCFFHLVLQDSLSLQYVTYNIMIHIFKHGPRDNKVTTLVHAQVILNDLFQFHQLNEEDFLQPNDLFITYKE